MARTISYNDNNPPGIYDHGPFVICQKGDQYRIEVELKGHHTSVLPDASISKLVQEKLDINLSWFTKHSLIATVVNWLNLQVTKNKIILDPRHGKAWICPATSSSP